MVEAFSYFTKKSLHISVQASFENQKLKTKNLKSKTKKLYCFLIIYLISKSTIPR